MSDQPVYTAEQMREAAAADLTDEEAYDAALSYQHDLGLLPITSQLALCAQARRWHSALAHRIRAIPIAPLPEVADVLSKRRESLARARDTE